MKICFLIGSPDIGGGTYVIFEHALHLQSMGMDVSILPIWQPDLTKPHWHPAIGALKFVTLEQAKAETYDMTIATWWRTIYELLPHVTTHRLCYFVQSIESWFYPDTDVAVRNLVNATYLLPMPGITEAHWIKQHLKTRFAHDYLVAPNGCRKDFFHADGPCAVPRQPGKLRALVEGPFGVDFKNVARSIELVRQSKVDEIFLLTSSDIDHYPGVSRVFSRVPTSECGAIYRSCDILVKLSSIEGMFGPPLEMFHCGGTAVVYNVTGHDEYIRHEHNALVVPMHDEAGVIAAINRLKDDPALLARLSGNALDTAKNWPDWPQASPVFASALQELMRGPLPDIARIRVMTAEFWAQYQRVEQALATTPRLAGKLRAVANRVPGMIKLVKSLRARHGEAKQSPVRRTQI